MYTNMDKIHEASKLSYYVKNYIRIRELDVFHFFLFLSIFALFSIFVHIVLTFSKSTDKHAQKSRGVPSIVDNCNRRI